MNFLLLLETELYENKHWRYNDNKERDETFMYKLYAFRTQMTNGDNETHSVPCLAMDLTRPDSDGAYVEVCKA